MNLVDRLSDADFINIIKTSSSIKDALRKIGYHHFSKGPIALLKARIERNNINTSHWNQNIVAYNHYTDEDIFVENSQVGGSVLRRAVLANPNIPYICSLCQQPPVYNGKELVLRLDHINGVNSDNRTENLRWICPNCDSQQDTYCGKNKSYAKNK